MLEYLKAQPSPCTLEQGVMQSLLTWAIGSLAHEQDSKVDSLESGKVSDAEKHQAIPDHKSLLGHLFEVLADKTVECAVLDRQQIGTSKYRVLKPTELARWLPSNLVRL